MPVNLSFEPDRKLLNVHVNGKLDKEDYEKFVPEVERLVEEHGKIRVLLQTEAFQGWDAGALWEDIKFSARHFNDIQRVAIVGEKKWEQGMATFCKPFTTAKVKYFDHAELDAAQKWVEE